MVIFSNCKINLGLNILRKRIDGYHDLETVFYPLLLYDVIEVVEQTKNSISKTEVEFTHSGLHFEVNAAQNLCLKSYTLLKNKFPDLPPVKIHLHKIIPMGAGLGGGSANASFTLRLLNDNFQLGLSQNELLDLAMQLGSDCPFFIINKPCFAESRGEILHEIKLDLSAYKFLIVNPNVHINTAWAFAQINPNIPSQKITDIIKLPVKDWKDYLINDFEKPVMKEYSFFENIKEQLYNEGALYASMSGSGSTFFGIFHKEKIISQNIFSENYFMKEINL